MAQQVLAAACTPWRQLISSMLVSFTLPPYKGLCHKGEHGCQSKNVPKGSCHAHITKLMRFSDFWAFPSPRAQSSQSTLWKQAHHLSRWLAPRLLRLHPCFTNMEPRFVPMALGHPGLPRATLPCGGQLENDVISPVPE